MIAVQHLHSSKRLPSGKGVAVLQDHSRHRKLGIGDDRVNSSWSQFSRFPKSEARASPIRSTIMLTRTKTAVLVVAFILSSAAEGLADSGSAGIAHFHAKRTSVRTHQSSFFVSNVSSRDVQVTLKLYDQNGNLIGTGGFLPVITVAGALSSCNVSNTSCVLPAGTSGLFDVTPTTTVGVDWWGHGSIEWSSSVDDPQTSALMVQGFLVITPVSGGDQIQLPLVVTRPLPF
jgi:hypothetical protein